MTVTAATATTAATAATATTVARPARADAAVEQTWDLQGLYPDTAAWEKDLARVDAMLPDIEQYRGRLGEGPDALLACLRRRDDLLQVAYCVEWYASNSLSEDQATRRGRPSTTGPRPSPRAWAPPSPISIRRSLRCPRGRSSPTWRASRGWASTGST